MRIDPSKSVYRNLRFDQLAEGASPRAAAMAVLDDAVKAAMKSGQSPVFLEITVHVAAPELNLDSELPLVCDPNRPDAETCESCQ